MKTFESLFVELAERQRTRPAGSSTVEALDAGCTPRGRRFSKKRARCGWPPSTSRRSGPPQEISQLLYRVQVIMLGQGITPNDVYRHL